jgi:hypothetical protein
MALAQEPAAQRFAAADPVGCGTGQSIRPVDQRDNHTVYGRVRRAPGPEVL